MPWSSLGTLTLTDQWQPIPTAVVNCETIRLIHATTIDPFNSCWLTQYFPLPQPGGMRVPWRRIYANEQATIITLEIPSDYRAQDILTYDIWLKWRTPYYPVSWVIEAQALY